MPFAPMKRWLSSAIDLLELSGPLSIISYHMMPNMQGLSSNSRVEGRLSNWKAVALQCIHYCNLTEDKKDKSA